MRRGDDARLGLDGRRARRRSPATTVLELAAGTGDTGFLAAELIQPGGTLISSDFVARDAHRRPARAPRRSGSTTCASGRSTPRAIDIEAASIDGVLCRWGYMLMADPEAALRETRRVLKPGGRVALAAWTGADDNPLGALPARELVDRGLAERRRPDAPGQFAWAQEGVIAEHLESAGFAEYEVDAVDFADRATPSVDDWWASTRDCRCASPTRRRRDSTTRRRAGVPSAALARGARRRSRRTTDGSLRRPGAARWVAAATALRPRASLRPCSTTTTQTSRCSTARPSPSSATARRATPTR